MAKKADVTVHGNEIHLGELVVTFQRTLRIPDDGRSYPLPPGLGSFPVRRVDDYAERVPSDWLEHGGVFLPMYQREAMWISFRGPSWKPRAVKVAVGKVCALTGKRWTEELRRKPQDYLVTPPQPWLDGVASSRRTIRQFVAMPLGLGYTVEGQVTGEERFGGIQLKVFEPKKGRFPEHPSFARRRALAAGGGAMPPCPVPGAPPSLGVECLSSSSRRSAGAMGLGAGGKMRQKVYRDPHGIGTWDPSRTARVYAHIVNSDLWREITGEAPPATPVTAKEYAAAGLPWFDLYDEGLKTVRPSRTLGKVKSVKELDEESSTLPLQDDDPVAVGPVAKLVATVARGIGIRDGRW